MLVGPDPSVFFLLGLFSLLSLLCLFRDRFLPIFHRFLDLFEPHWAAWRMQHVMQMMWGHKLQVGLGIRNQ